MKVLKEAVGDVCVLTLKGEFDSFVTNPFSNEIAKVQGEGVHKIVLNMRLVKFINSTALGAMIKARKNCRREGGDLVVSQPSTGVREAMDSLGLDRLFSTFEEDEAALAALNKSGSVDLDESAESAVMLHLPELGRPIVGRLRRLEADTLECRVPSDVGNLLEGREVRLKFRLPLYRKEYFDVTTRIERRLPEDGTVLLTLRFTQMSGEDRAAIGSFVEDMRELRNAARGSP